ncbi:MAG: hypothetical protein ACI4EB_03535 [Bilifractor sp.]
MKDIRIAIIGHEFIGHEHEMILGNFPGTSPVGFADRDPKQLESVTGRPEEIFQQ